jgi:hypothetical protein
MTKAIYQGFILRKDAYKLPARFAMPIVAGNRVVREVLAAFLAHIQRLHAGCTEDRIIRLLSKLGCKRSSSILSRINGNVSNLRRHGGSSPAFDVQPCRWSARHRRNAAVCRVADPRPGVRLRPDAPSRCRKRLRSPVEGFKFRRIPRNIDSGSCYPLAPGLGLFPPRAHTAACVAPFFPPRGRVSHRLIGSNSARRGRVGRASE